MFVALPEKSQPSVFSPPSRAALQSCSVVCLLVMKHLFFCLPAFYFFFPLPNQVQRRKTKVKIKSEGSGAVMGGGGASAHVCRVVAGWCGRARWCQQPVFGFLRLQPRAGGCFGTQKCREAAGVRRFKHPRWPLRRVGNFSQPCVSHRGEQHSRRRPPPPPCPGRHLLLWPFKPGAAASRPAPPLPRRHWAIPPSGGWSRAGGGWGVSPHTPRDHRHPHTSARGRRLGRGRPMAAGLR